MKVPASGLAWIGMVWASAGLAADGPQIISSGTGEWRIGPASDPNCHFQGIQDAIDATIANDGGLSTIFIRVAGNAALHRGNTYGINLDDFDNITTINIIGGHASCQGSPVSGERTVLDADGNDRVFDLLYHAADSDPVRTVILQNLEITGGNPGFAGGGVRIEGHSGRQRVQFLNVDIHNNVTNSVGSGGGVSIEATEGSDSPTNWVNFSGGSSIRDNFAVGSGGGLACFNLSGQENPPVLLFETLVSNNQAVFNGGGIAINGCRNVSVRAQGMDHAIMLNRAGASGSQGDGGGLYINRGQVTVEASGTQTSAVFFGNTADHGGGAAITDPGSRLDLVNVRINANTANNHGGGIYADVSAQWAMGRQGGGTGFPGTCLPLFDSDARCSMLSGNVAEGNGGAAAMRGGARGELDQTFVDVNFSDGGLGSVFFLADADTKLDVEGAVIHENHGSSELMHIADSGHLRMRWSTIAGNKRENDKLRVFRVVSSDDSTRLEFDSSIVWEPGAEIVSSTGSAQSVSDCVIGHLSEAGSGIGSATFYSQIDPRLVDPEIGDLRLKPSSPAVDYCDEAFQPSHNDMFNNPRGVPLGGPVTEPPNAIDDDFDIGAHELQQQLEDAVFEDRFEAN